MYKVDWIEQLKLRAVDAPTARQVARVSPVVWKMGFTSLLTDISAEMLNSALPVYIVLYLHLSPVQYGAIDGIYNGLAVALLSLAGGLTADRARRHKEVAAAGYGLSAICKLLFLFAGGAWGWMMGIAAVDRIGKGARTAPRDSLISLNSSKETLATSFAVHRALDAGGSLAGPFAAFAILAWLPGAFDAVWVTSFVFAALGWSVLWLFVANPPSPIGAPSGNSSIRSAWGLLAGRRYRALTLAGALLALVTASDGFIYLIMQQKAGTASGAFPLFYVMTAGCYMLFSIPAGRLADSWGRMPVFLGGYLALGVLYGLLFSFSAMAWPSRIACFVLFGLYYAATEGVLAAMASAVIPAERRTSGLAILATLIGLAKMASSVAFGWIWQSTSTGFVLAVFGGALAIAIAVSAISLRATAHEAA
jgi:MFS family permease